MQNKRFDEVDVLRAFGIIAVIAIHILTYNLSNPINKFLWNYLQFFIIAFVFCSGFVLSAIYQNSIVGITKTFRWYRKRFVRLIAPFWIYLVLHYALWILFPNNFQGLGLQKSVSYFINSLVLVGGTNYNWFPLLFLQLTLLFPLFLSWINKRKIIYAYLLGSFLIILLFTLFKFPYSYYRFVMWVPWSLVLLFAIYFYKSSKSIGSNFEAGRRYLTFGLFFLVIFLVLHLANLDLGKSLNFYDHKYPPDFYYLSFGLSLTCFSLYIARLRIWQNEILKKIYLYVSKNSYQLFFVHYIILDAVLVLSHKMKFLNNPLNQFIVIFLTSILIIILSQKIMARVFRK